MGTESKFYGEKNVNTSRSKKDNESVHSSKDKNLCSCKAYSSISIKLPISLEDTQLINS